MAHPIDLVAPDLRRYIDALPNLGTLSTATLPQVRAMAAGDSLVTGVTAGVDASWVTLAGLDGEADVRALLYRPVGRDGALPAVLNIHGGGYVAGSPLRDDAAMRSLVTRLGCVGLSLEYRLAPEAPYPAAFNDCRAGLAALHAMPGVDPSRIAVRGVSAGGGLALALGLCARDGGAPAIAHLHLIYPMLDDRTGPDRFNGKFVWTAEANSFAWSALLSAVDRQAPPAYAVPGRATDFAGLPPVFLGTGSIDLFAQENIAAAVSMIAAGVAVDLRVYAGAFHGFDLIADAGVAQAFARDSFAAIERHLKFRETSE